MDAQGRGTSTLGGQGAWPQNLPLKFVSEPQILPPKIQVTSTTNFALLDFRSDPKIGILSQLFYLVVTELPEFVLLFGELG